MGPFFYYSNEDPSVRRYKDNPWSIPRIQSRKKRMDWSKGKNIYIYGNHFAIHYHLIFCNLFSSWTELFVDFCHKYHWVSTFKIVSIMMIEIKTCYLSEYN